MCAARTRNGLPASNLQEQRGYAKTWPRTSLTPGFRSIAFPINAEQGRETEKAKYWNKTQKGCLYYSDCDAIPPFPASIPMLIVLSFVNIKRTATAPPNISHIGTAVKIFTASSDNGSVS